MDVIRIKMYKEINKILPEFDDISQKNPSEVHGRFLVEKVQRLRVRPWQIYGRYQGRSYLRYDISVQREIRYRVGLAIYQ